MAGQDTELQTYIAITVTLPADTLAHDLASLLKAVEPNCPLVGREINIQNDTSVAGNLRIGDAKMNGAARCGYVLTTGQSRLYRSNSHDIPVGMFYVQGSVASMVVNVEIIQ